MALVQQVLEAGVARGLSCSRVEQIQDCHSAVESLLLNLQSIKQMSKQQVLLSKKDKVALFISINQELLHCLHGQYCQPVWKWLLYTVRDSPLLVNLVSQNPENVKKTLADILGATLSQEEDSKHEKEIAQECLSLLENILEQTRLGKVPTRDRLRVLDEFQVLLDQRLDIVTSKSKAFDIKILSLICSLQAFEKAIVLQFRTNLQQFSNGLICIPQKWQQLSKHNLQQLSQQKTHTFWRTLSSKNSSRIDQLPNQEHNILESE